MNFFSFLIIFIFQINFNNANNSDLNSFNVYLTKYSNKTHLNFCQDQNRSEQTANEPCLISVYNDDEILSEENIKSYLYSNFLFANLTELVRKQKIESKTTLRRFLKQQNEYTDETTLEMQMPQFLRFKILISLSSILNFFKSFLLIYSDGIFLDSFINCKDSNEDALKNLVSF